MSQPWTPPGASGGASGSVPNYLIPAILSLFCCFPLGIAGVIFAAQVNGKVASGDMPGALDASKKAKLFSYIAIGLGLAFWVVYFVIMILFGGLAVLGNI